MRKAANVIPIIESLVSQMTPVVTISLIEVDGVNWKLHSCDTYWTMRDMTVTIGGVDFTVLSVVQDSYIIVSGLALPVGASYQLPAPQFWHGSHRKVNSEMSEESDAGQAVVYLPVPRVRETNDPEEEVVYTASIRPIFLYTYDQQRDTIELQQDEVIEPLNAMADFFLWLIEDNDGSYNTPEDVDRREWMNFGDENVWGNDKLIFNRNYSGVELQFDLEVLPDGVCACDDVAPITCAPVPFYLNGTFEEDLTSGEDFQLAVVDTNNVEVGTYNDLTNTVTVPAAGGGGGTASQTFNGAAVTDQISDTTKVITVKDSGGNNVGTKGTDNALALAIQIADATQTMNGSAITSQLPETAKTFVIRYANNDPVTVTTITDTDTSFIGEVPDVVVPLNTANLFKTGQTTSYVTNDDGDLERGNGASFTTLSHDNYFGNTNRFTDTLGGQTYSDNWVIDWSTWNQITGSFTMWHRVYEVGNTWANVMAAQPFTRGAYNDCYLPNRNELTSILNNEANSNTNYAPFNINVVAANNLLWTSTTCVNNTAAAFAFQGTTGNNGLSGVSKTSSQRYILMRIGNISEL